MFSRMYMVTTLKYSVDSIFYLSSGTTDFCCASLSTLFQNAFGLLSCRDRYLWFWGVQNRYLWSGGIQIVT